mmetsp:Transcript_5110/g.17026  ORF Transcript_5110/g.17026 Transcript_5110/m.17026 type:complete len:83 (+) Transcript_5110:587-835(+)
MPSGSFTVPWAYAIATERLLARRTASFDGTLTPLKPADLAVPARRDDTTPATCAHTGAETAKAAIVRVNEDRGTWERASDCR